MCCPLMCIDLGNFLVVLLAVSSVIGGGEDAFMSCGVNGVLCSQWAF